MDIKKLSNDIINGKRLTREDDLSFFKTVDLDELCSGADEIREKLCGNHIDLCSIINGRSGGCSENCKFCAQSAHHHTSVERYKFLEPEEIVKDCEYHYNKGVHRYSIVTAGRTLEGEDLERLVKHIKKCMINMIFVFVHLMVL